MSVIGRRLGLCQPRNHCMLSRRRCGRRPPHSRPDGRSRACLGGAAGFGSGGIVGGEQSSSQRIGNPPPLSVLSYAVLCSRDFHCRLGSAAAGSMGSGVAAGSVFATLQSAAMGGYGVTAVAGAVQGAGAAVAGVSGGVATWLQSKKS